MSAILLFLSEPCWPGRYFCVELGYRDRQIGHRAEEIVFH